jgi:hypothetical protein
MTAVRPRVPGASVAFLVGQRAAGVKDDFLDQAKVWVDKIASSAGAGVFVEKLGSPKAVATVITQLSARAAKATLSNATLDRNLGGLRGHTLVFTTHGLDVDPTLSKQDQLDTQGLLFRNDTVGRSQSDVVMMKFHLDRMKLDGGGQVVFDGSVPTQGNEKLVRDIIDFAAVLDAVKQAVFDQVYFAACGGDRRLDQFAIKFQELTATAVYHNGATIFLPTKGTPPFAEVGIEDPQTKQVTRSQGFTFYQAHSGTPTLDLVSTTDGFLPGSTARTP